LKDATTQTSEGQRGAHQLNKRATLDRRVPLFGLLRKLTRYKLTKRRRISQFFEAAPILFAAALRFTIL
jgi:hypothetical protein